MTAQTIAELLIRYRNKAGISQRELGLLLGLSSQKVCDVEKGRRRPSLSAVVKLAKLLDLPEAECVQIRFQEELDRDQIPFRVTVRGSDAS